MPTMAPQRQAAPAQTAPAAQVKRKFRAGVQVHEEAMSTIVSAAPTTNPIPYSVAIPAYGFLRGLWLKVVVTGGVGSGTAAVYKQDAPFTWIQSISVTDTNSQAIISQHTGHDLYVIHKYGGYRYSGDVKRNTRFYTQGGIGGNSAFFMRLPFELRSRDGAGALPNQNDNTAYKLQGSVGPLSDVFSTNPAPTLPTNITVTAYLDAWWDPQDTDLMGRQQAQEPPGNAVQNWNKQVYSQGASGAMTAPHTRKGMPIRKVVYIWRDNTGARADSSFPATSTIVFEGWQWKILDRDLWIEQMAEDTGYVGTAETAGGPDTGVFVLDCTNDFGLQPGADMGTGYLPTTSGSRFEFQGSTGTSGALTILTNDIAVRDDILLAGV